MDSFEKWEFEDVKECLLCGAATSKVIYHRTVRSIPLTFVQCPVCRLVYQAPRLTPAAMAGYFSSKTFIRDGADNKGGLKDLLGYPDYFEWDQSYKLTARRRLARIRRFVSPPAKLLEIGTATGSFLDEARTSGFQVRGLDISETFADMARKTFGLEVDIGAIEEYPLPEACYDIVCCWGGIACWRDPSAGLANVRRALRPNGLFALNHSNRDNVFVRMQGKRYFEYNHASLTILSCKTMARLLENGGFQTLFCQSERQYASLGRILSYLRSDFGHKALRFLHLKDLTIPVIVPGTQFRITRRQDEG